MVVKQLKKDVLSLTMKMGEQIGTLMLLLEQAQTEVNAVKKQLDAVIQGLCKLCVGEKPAGYERKGLDAKLQRPHHEREKCTQAINRVQRGAGERKELAKKDSADLRCHIEKH